MPKRRVLLAGEAWVSTATPAKGLDQFAGIPFHVGAKPLVAALADSAVRQTVSRLARAEAAP